MHLHLGLAKTPLAELVLVYGGILFFLLSVFRKPELGLYFMVPMLPLQTVRYRIHGYPLGSLFVDIMLLGVGLGLLRRGKPMLARTELNKILAIFAGLTYLLLWRGSFTIGAPLPLWFSDPRMSDWKNYMVMPLLFLVSVSALTTRRQMKILLILMCASVLVLDKSFINLMSQRDMSSFSYDMRDAGAMGYAGVNGLGAFAAQFSIFLIAMAGVARKWWRPALFVTLALTLLALMYSFSRGAYLGLCVGLLYLGVRKNRLLLVILVLFLSSWQTLVPPAVRQRVLMTRGENGEIESSAAERLSLWDEAMQIFRGDPLFGMGFNTYGTSDHVGGYRDTHNVYVKVLVETGLVGLSVFLILLGKMHRQARLLMDEARDPFLSSLGIAFAGLMITLAVVNFFGDRWTYLQISGYTWTLLAMVVRGRMIAADERSADGEHDELAGPEIEAVSATLVTC